MHKYIRSIKNLKGGFYEIQDTQRSLYSLTKGWQN